MASAPLSARSSARPRSPSARRIATGSRPSSTRLERSREQIGPVNPLAEREYAEAREHVTELAEQRKDLERAITRAARADPAHGPRDRRGLRGDLRGRRPAASRRWSPSSSRAAGDGCAASTSAGSRPFAGQAPEPEDGSDDDEESTPPDEDGGVEIEVTPAGKSTRRLSLLSGGEKSLVALAFVFAVLMARPCPFYILDEVEAALDDINIDRFLRLVRRFAERSQFIVVTHQKRTMDAADILYGVSMGGDGVTKVVSRKLPRDELGTGLEPTAGSVADGDGGPPAAAEAA